VCVVRVTCVLFTVQACGAGRVGARLAVARGRSSVFVWQGIGTMRKYLVTVCGHYYTCTLTTYNVTKLVANYN